MKITYAVVKIDVTLRGSPETKRFTFEDVNEAIKVHKEMSKNYSEFSYWNLIVEYEG